MQQLREQAARNDRSMEEEAQAILENALAGEEEVTTKKLADNSGAGRNSRWKSTGNPQAKPFPNWPFLMMS
jgi:plasmid stability protein